MTAHDTCHHVTYLLTCDQYTSLLARANGRCERCGDSADDGKLQIDHDGDSGFAAVRGLICPSCNIHLMLIETGRRDSDPQTEEYLARAWHLTATVKQAGTHATRMVTRQARVDDRCWEAFGKAVKKVGAKDRSDYLREVMRWVIHDPDGKRPVAPKRPTDPTPKPKKEGQAQ